MSEAMLNQESTSSPQTSDTSSAPPSVETQTSQPETSSSSVDTQNPPQVSAYQANYRFKVMDKEHEIPEPFRPVIKDAETEKMAREIFEKAYGLDHVKSERARLQEEYKKYRSEHEPYFNYMKTLEDLYHKKDLNQFFTKLSIPKNEIYKWAIQQAQLEELPPEQKQVYTEREELQRQQYLQEQQFQQVQQQLQTLQVQQRSAELQSVLSKPEVQSIVQSFDQRNGQNSFWDAVVERGQMYYYMHGKDVPAEQLVQEIIQKFGLSAPQMQSQPQVQTPKAPPQVPVIPNTGSGNASPAQRAVKSLDDLRRIATEKYG